MISTLPAFIMFNGSGITTDVDGYIKWRDKMVQVVGTRAVAFIHAASIAVVCPPEPGAKAGIFIRLHCCAPEMVLHIGGKYEMQRVTDANVEWSGPGSLISVDVGFPIENLAVVEGELARHINGLLY